MNLFRFKKKGQIQNYVLIPVILVFFAFFSMLGMQLHTQFIDSFNETGYYEGAVQETGEKFNNVFLIFDKIVALILVVLIIFVGVSSYRIKTRPMYFIVSIILVPFMAFVSFFFNYLFTQLVTQDAIASMQVYFPMSMVICTNLHWVALIAFIVGSVTLYGKKNDDFEPLQ